MLVSITLLRAAILTGILRSLSSWKQYGASDLENFRVIASLFKLVNALAGRLGFEVGHDGALQQILLLAATTACRASICFPSSRDLAYMTGTTILICVTTLVTCVLPSHSISSNLLSFLHHHGSIPWPKFPPESPVPEIRFVGIVRRYK